MTAQRALPGLYETPERVELTPSKRVNVPRSSVEAYHRTHAGERAATVTRWLWACTMVAEGMTSAELTARVCRESREACTTERLLYVRRGLSDALAKGLVEHGPKRDCKVAGTLAVTWKVRSR